MRRSAAIPAILLTLALVVASLGGCRPRERWNVLLVTFDTTRADRLGCYGNERIRTPTLDHLAAEGVRFARAMSAVPITAPSHTTIMTGRYPIAHGVRDNGLFVLADEQLTLAEILRDEGYATAAAVGSFPVTAKFGLNQGFSFFDDHLTGAYEDYLGNRAVPKASLFFDERRAAQVNEAVLPWITEHAAQPFFVWVHYFDPHQPFEPPPPFDQLYADDLYNGEIAYADSRLGFLLDHLKGLGVLDHTLVVMTADHGEGRGEHNELTHAVLAYNATLHVPLIVRPPQGAAPAGTVVEERVGTVDIVPTVLDLLGIELPRGGPQASLQGRSLVPLWRDEGGLPPVVRYAENLSPRLTHGWGELRVLFDGPLKYIHGPRPELYDVDADPHELHDLIAERPDDARRMQDALRGFLRDHAVAGVSTTEALDEDTRRRLESLGYLHGAGTGGEKITESLRADGIPPQDRVTDINEVSAAKHLLFAGRFTDALAYTEKLVAGDSHSPLYLELHASALIQLGRLDEAQAVLDRMGERGAVPVYLQLRLAASLFESGLERAAVDSLSRSVAATPSAQSAWLLASLHDRLGDRDQARAALEKALELEPAYSPARVDLAIRFAQAGDAPAAEREFLTALKDAPYYPKAHYNYGTFLLQGGRFEDAASFFRRAIALSPGYLKAHLALVAAYVSAGDRPRAEAAYEALSRMAPQSPETATAAGFLAAP